MKKSYCALDGKVREAASLSEDEKARFDLVVKGTLVSGHGVASGKNRDIYPKGSVELQYPFFKELGIDIGECYPGTLNVSIAPRTYEIKKPYRSVQDLLWYPPRKMSENFDFARCLVQSENFLASGLVYRPDPKTKKVHFDKPEELQIIAGFLPDAGYGDALTVYLHSDEITISG